MNVISSFEVAIKCLQNPYLISRLFSLSGFGMVPQAYNFWKWGALILALLATLSSIIRRIKIIFIHLHAFKSSPQAFVQSNDLEFSDDDEFTSVSSQEEEGRSPMTSFEDQQDVDEEFSVKGSNLYSRSQWEQQCCGGENERFSLSGFTSGKHVVKLWDGFGFGFNCFKENDSNEKNSHFSGRNYWTIPAVAVASTEMVFTAEGNGKGDGVVFGGYDTRMPRRVPAISAEWRSPAEAVTDMVSLATVGVEKVYVRDKVTGVLTVGDVRNVTAPLENVVEYDVDTCREADFVFVDWTR